MNYKRTFNKSLKGDTIQQKMKLPDHQGNDNYNLMQIEYI